MGRRAKQEYEGRRFFKGFKPVLAFFRDKGVLPAHGLANLEELEKITPGSIDEFAEANDFDPQALRDFFKK